VFFNVGVSSTDISVVLLLRFDQELSYADIVGKREVTVRSQVVVGAERLHRRVPPDRNSIRCA